MDTIWQMYNPQDWSLGDVPEYAAFVYLIEFPDSGEYYIGVKQTYQKLKHINQRKSDTKESNWSVYNSSSKTVKQYIEDGEKHTKKILWCFPTVQEAALVETALISIFGSDSQCLNKAIMTKTRLIKNKGSTTKIIQEVLSWLV